MAASDFDYAATRNEILYRALQIVGAIALGEVPSGEELNQALGFFQDRVKALQSQHLFPWQFKQQNIALVDGQATYAASTDPKIIGIDRAYLLDLGTNKESPLAVVSWDQYQDIPDKAATGEPCAVAMLPYAPHTIYTYPVANAVAEANREINIWGVSTLKDWDTVAGTGDFLTEYSRALGYLTAADLADVYKLPLSERAWLTDKAREAHKTISSYNLNRGSGEFVKGAY